MRQLQPVLWTKGLVLAPQHLQAQDRFFEDRLGFQVGALLRWPWGFSRLRFDDQALAAGAVSVVEAAGAFGDGTVFDVPSADAAIPPRAIAGQWAGDETALLVHLAIPDYRADGRNVSASDDDGNTRYRADVVDVRDEVTGLSERPLQVARKNLRLLIEGESFEGYATLPVARVVRAPSGEMGFDAEFVPPLIDFAASPPLMLLARRLVELLTTRSAVLSAMRRQRNLDVAQFSTSDIANFWLLYTVNQHLPVLRHLAETRHGHPVTLFEEMLGLAGTLTTFSTSTQPGDFPQYNHLDLGTCFARLDAALRNLLETAVPENVVSLPLREVEPSIHAAAVDEDRLLGAPRLYLAVRSRLPRPELIRLVPQLVKVTSSDRISLLVRQALGGTPLTHTPTPHTAVPVKLDYEYFEIDRTSREWESVVSARNVAAYVPAEFAQVSLELVFLLAPRG
jgi:type VI secretion system protein ImpJ